MADRKKKKTEDLYSQNKSTVKNLRIRNGKVGEEFQLLKEKNATQKVFTHIDLLRAITNNI